MSQFNIPYSLDDLFSTMPLGSVERAEVNVTIRTLIKIANAIEISPVQFFSFILNSDTKKG